MSETDWLKIVIRSRCLELFDRNVSFLSVYLFSYSMVCSLVFTDLSIVSFVETTHYLFHPMSSVDKCA